MHSLRININNHIIPFQSNYINTTKKECIRNTAYYFCRNTKIVYSRLEPRWGPHGTPIIFNNSRLRCRGGCRRTSPDAFQHGALLDFHRSIKFALDSSSNFLTPESYAHLCKKDYKIIFQMGFKFLLNRGFIR